MKLSIVVAAALFAVGAQAAEMKVFKQPNFTGDALTLKGEVTDLTRRGFQDQISSVVVTSGRWQVCTQPGFGGDCVILDRGEYPSLDSKLMHRIESARVVEDRPQRVARRAREGSIELYARRGFEGRTLRIDRDEATLEGSGLEQRVASVIVNEGTWQVCTRPGYQGFCRVLEPGQYADLGRMRDQVASIRQIG